MRNTTVVSVVIFVLAYGALGRAFGNHGLWASYIVLFLARTATLGARLPRLVRSAFA
jgi:MATE family multidrug resistance protein